MADSLSPLPRTRLYEQLMQRLLGHIHDSGLQPGERLPSERDLSERLQVSRNSLKQAMVALEVQGIVATRHGGGTYYLGASRPTESVTELIDRKHRLPDILEAREAIEVKVAELAAQRRTPEDLVALQKALDEMAKAIADGSLGVEADRAFHSAVVGAARNSILSRFYEEISLDISESRLESLRQPGRPERSLAQHQQIFDAISAGQPKAAVAAVHRHVATVGKVRLLSWQLDESDGE